MSFEQKVKEVIANKISPYLQQHGGGVDVKKIEGGTLWLVYKGTCKTCPSAQITTEEIVEKLLREELGNELKRIHLVTETDKELLDFAKKILRKDK